MLSSPDKADILDILSPAANKMLMTTGKGIYQSTDWGNSWTIIKKEQSFLGILVNVSPNLIFWISNYGDYYSTNGGLNWELTEVHLDEWLRAVAGRDNVIAVGSFALSISADGGLTFKNREPNPDYGVTDLAVNNKHEIFVSDDYYLHKTDPTFSNWESVTFPNSPMNIQIDAQDNIYVSSRKADNNFLLKSSDDGKSWQQLFQTKVIRNFNILEDGKIILSTDQGLMISDSKQQNFSVLNNVFKGLDVNKIYAADKNHLFEILGYGNYIPATLYRSEDGGKSWVKSFSDNKDDAYDVVQFKNQLVLTTGHAIYSSADAGQNWQLMASFPEGIFMTDLTVSGDKIIGSGAEDLYVSTDLNNWKKFYTSTSSYPYDSAYSINNTLLVASTNKILVSTDGGQTWQTALDKVNSSNHLLRGYQDKVVLAIYEKTGIFKTTDAGKTWTKISAAISTSINDVVLIDEKTYAALTDDNIYLTQDAGQTWTVLNKGINNQNVTNLFASKDYLFAKSENNGIYQAV